MKIESGQRFGRLVTTVVHGKANDKHLLWQCHCDCGAIVIRQSNVLRASNTPSCGCAAKDIHAKHGMRKTREYASWRAAKERCFNAQSKDFANYGARGITMCLAWSESFESFYESMGPRPHGTTLERKDVNGSYEPGNCLWATATEQIRNRRVSTYIDWRGARQHLSEVANQLGITYGATFMRHKRGTLHADS